MSETLTAHFARLGATLRFETLTAAAVNRAKASILDALGCILAGAASEDARLAQAGGRADGAGRAPVLGTALTLSPTYAALANGTAGHAYDFDDSSPPMIGHPSVPLVSAMVSAAGDRRVSGREMIAAFVAGLEIAAALGRRMNPAHYEAGWHATATLGTLGATLAAGRVAGLDEAQLANALGVAASTSAGVRKNFGSMVKPLHAGLAARNGVLAVQLASAGFRADPAALDGANGFVDVFRGDADAPNFIFGGPLEIDASGIGIKRYPCCGCTHSVLDALLSLRAEHGFRGDEVASIHTTMNGFVPDVLVHHRPTTPAQAKFSMEYCLAVAALDGACGLDQFAEARVSAADAQDLLARVETSVDPAIAYRNGVYPGTVTVTLKDGRTLSRHAEEALGHPDFPLSTADLEQKFMACATRAIGPAQARAAFAMLAALDDAPALPDLIKTLTPKGDES